MNNYSYQSFRQMEPNYIPNQSSSAPGVGGMISEENINYAENILSLNKGKVIKVYMSFSDSIEWRDKTFEGTLESWGRDFLLLNDKKNNKWYMIWNIYIDYIEFNERVNF